jgi:hypothetical protein
MIASSLPPKPGPVTTRVLYTPDSSYVWLPCLVRTNLDGLCSRCQSPEDRPYPQAACLVHYAIGLRELHEAEIPTLEREMPLL